MRTHGQLPPELGQEFSVDEARAAGTTPGRLRGRDLARPFHGVRTLELKPRETPEKRAKTGEKADAPADPDEARRREALKAAHSYSHRMRDCEFFSHETAALIWNAPLPRAHKDAKGHFGFDPVPHVSVFHGDSEPRARGIHGHRIVGEPAQLKVHDGLRVASPALTWVTLGHLALYDLVAVGDYFARMWRKDGFFRVNPGMPPLATGAQMDAAVQEGRRTGIRSLRAALPLIRMDAWSRPETWTRLTLADAGLPEPVLNRDHYDRFGDFLACVDLAYPAHKVAIEYQGQHHGAQYARDIERIEQLRAEGWIVIQVSSVLLFDNPAELVRRVRSALIERGWRG